MEFCGESFLFYGLIDFMLFSTLAWRKWLLQSEIFLCLLLSGVLALLRLPRTLSNNWLFSFLFPLTGGSPHFRFRVPANRLASTFPCQATRVRSPSINIWSPCDPYSFLTVILWWLATVNSNKRIVVISLSSSQWDITWQFCLYDGPVGFNPKLFVHIDWLPSCDFLRNCLWVWYCFVGTFHSHDTTIRIHIYAETKSTIMTNEHTSLEKYTSHTLFERVVKVLCMRGEMETEQTATYSPQVPLSLAALLSRSAWLLNRGSRGSKPSAGSCFSLHRTPTNWFQLTRTLCGTGLYNCLTSTCFLWASHLHRIQAVHGQGYILISSTGCTCFSIDSWVDGQYVTGRVYY